MEELRKKVGEFYDQKYEENETVIRKDYFCPLIKQMCLGNNCAFWVSDADDDEYIGDHPCSINILGSYIIYEKWKD